MLEETVLDRKSVAVEPKKRYRYRVALALRDPNFGLPAHVLKDPGKKREEVIETSLSEPTETVTVPTGYLVLAAGVGKGTKADPGAKLMVSQIDQKEGLEVPGEMEVLRGSVANFTAKDLTVVNPNGGVTELSDVEIKTGVLVLDVHGGRPLSSKRDAALSPIEVLILDPEGNLSVRNELDDQGMVQRRQPPESRSREKDSQPIPDTDNHKSKSKSTRKR